MKKSLIFIIILLLSTFICAKKKTYGNLTCDKLTRVYDGDTFYCNLKNTASVFGKKIGIRVYGIDTPEIRTRNKAEKKKGYEAKRFAAKLLKSAKLIELRSVRRGKYFRIVAVVFIDGKNFAEIMIKKGFAVRYFGGKKN